LNDVFSLFFTALAITAGWQQEKGLALGMTLYGVLYFLLHDLMVHGRWGAFKPRGRWLFSLRKAHWRHHQSVTRCGQEPFGFLLFTDL
jgi:beta-carotene 3-hydroxylase